MFLDVYYICFTMRPEESDGNAQDEKINGVVAGSINIMPEFFRRGPGNRSYTYRW